MSLLVFTLAQLESQRRLDTVLPPLPGRTFLPPSSEWWGAHPPHQQHCRSRGERQGIYPGSCRGDVQQVWCWLWGTYCSSAQEAQRFVFSHKLCAPPFILSLRSDCCFPPPLLTPSSSLLLHTSIHPTLPPIHPSLPPSFRPTPLFPPSMAHFR